MDQGKFIKFIQNLLSIFFECDYYKYLTISN